jgi:hypothetical protein
MINNNPYQTIAATADRKSNYTQAKINLGLSGSEDG